ncbi:MAG TPA: hypothetical protein VGP39_19135 [Bradyrhizobium sp.]|nr:hypothetical protein [Bradyrhizobium sp.]
MAIAAAAIASGSVVLAGDAGAATISVAAMGTAIMVETAAVTAAVCNDAAGSADVVGSVAVTMSGAASSMADFTIPVCVDPGFAGSQTASASAFEPAAGCTALGSSSCEAVFATAVEEDAASRGCRPSEVADGSSGRCEGRCGVVGVVRSLPEVSAALLSISAEKLSGAGDWSAFADLDGAF